MVKSKTVSTGVWYTDLNEIGAVDENGAPTASARVDLTARTLGFDSARHVVHGRLLGRGDQPGRRHRRAGDHRPRRDRHRHGDDQPNGIVGKTVSGSLIIYTPPAFLSAFNTTGDVLASVPYTYTVGKPSTS